MPLLQINCPINGGSGSCSLKSHLKNIKNVFLESVALHLSANAGGNDHFNISTNIPCMSRNVCNEQDRIFINDDGASTYLRDEYHNCRYHNADFLHVVNVNVQKADDTPATTVDRVIITFSYF
jgi:hypothetical protein